MASQKIEFPHKSTAMSSKRKAPEALLQRRVRPRREPSEESENLEEVPFSETDEEDGGRHNSKVEDATDEVGATRL